MNLLRRTDDSGYPPAYLAARIQGRRTWLISDWEPLLAAANPLDALPKSPYRGRPEGWKTLLREISWLHRQMDRRQQHIFAPLFAWIELRTLILCLRNMLDDRTGRIEALLQQSLLAADLKKLLLQEGDPGKVLAAVVAALVTDSSQRRRLLSIHQQEGLAGFERELADLQLAETVAGRLHPLIRDFLASLIDARNMIILYKHLRWQISALPAFIAGGRKGLPLLRKLAKEATEEDVLLLVKKLTGTETTVATPDNLERLLLSWITRKVRRWGRSPSGPGMILDYLWRCYLETRNLGTLSHCRGADRDLLRKELIQ